MIQLKIPHSLIKGLEPPPPHPDSKNTPGQMTMERVDLALPQKFQTSRAFKKDSTSGLDNWYYRKTCKRSLPKDGFIERNY